jgi:hypothetical protein
MLRQPSIGFSHNFFRLLARRVLGEYLGVGTLEIFQPEAQALIDRALQADGFHLVLRQFAEQEALEHDI